MLSIGRARGRDSCPLASTATVAPTLLSYPYKWGIRFFGVRDIVFDWFQFVIVCGLCSQLWSDNINMVALEVSGNGQASNKINM